MRSLELISRDVFNENPHKWGSTSVGEGSDGSNPDLLH